MMGAETLVIVQGRFSVNGVVAEARPADGADDDLNAGKSLKLGGAPSSSGFMISGETLPNSSSSCCTLMFSKSEKSSCSTWNVSQAQ